MFNSVLYFVQPLHLSLPLLHTLFILSHLFMATAAPKPAEFHEINMLYKWKQRALHTMSGRNIFAHCYWVVWSTLASILVTCLTLSFSANNTK